MEQSQSDYLGLPADPYNPLFAGQLQENRVGLAQELNPQAPLIEAIYSLRGELRNPKTNEVEIKFTSLMNEEGVALFIHIVRAAANAINTFSNYRTDDKLIYRLLKKWINDAIYEFYINRKKYGIKEESHCSIIVNHAVGLMLPSFFKALGAGDRGAVSKSVQEHIQTSMGQQPNPYEPKRRGLLSMMNPFNRG